MRFLVGPPSKVQPGAIISPPVLVEVEDQITSKLNAKEANLLWAFVSITDEAGTTTLAPPDNNLVTGNLTGSLSVSDRDSKSIGNGNKIISFSNLAIQRPGNYRLRVSLMKHDASGKQGATNLEAVISSVVRVG